MKKLVVALALASVGFSPVFAAETVTPKATETKKTEEQAKPAASAVKKEGTLLVVACDATCPATDSKKDTQTTEQPAQTPAKKVAIA
jgi:hypothetical protein